MVSFAKLAAPAREEFSHILERVALKTLAMVRHRGLLADGLARAPHGGRAEQN
jgi:hypothetical protein